MATRPAALEQLLKSRLAAAPALQKGTNAAPPSVEVPSLEGLEVEVRAPAPPTDDDFAVLIERARRAVAHEVWRARGELCEATDEFVVDLVGYYDGAPVPFTCRRRITLDVDTDALLPRMRELLAGVAVGSARVMKIVMPDTEHLLDYGGMEITYAVDVHGACEVTLPEMSDPAFLASIGAAGEDEVPERVAEIAAAEAASAVEEDARTAVLDLLVARTKMELDPAWVDETIRRRFNDADGALLIEKGVSVEKQAEAIEYWMIHPVIREEAERDVRVSFILGALRDALNIAPGPEDFALGFEGLASSWGVSVDEVKARIREDKDALDYLAGIFMLARIIDVVMSKAKIRVVGLDDANP